eukprot:6208136-Pleurochrysis_carterae.AAC.3
MRALRVEPDREHARALRRQPVCAQRRVVRCLKERDTAVLASNGQSATAAVERHAPRSAAVRVPRSRGRDRAQIPLGDHAVESAAQDLISVHV